MGFDPTKHKNIIFDLGAVLLNLDYNRTVEAFKLFNANFHSIDAVYSNASDKKLFEDFETGSISSSAFRKGIRKILERPELSDSEIDKAWNAMLLDFPVERIGLLKRLKLKHKIFLLSNSNEIHIDAYLRNLEKEHGLKDLSHIFIKEYYSYKIKLRKPDKKIFEFVLRENNLDPSETFFIDDSPQHVEGARSAGIDAYLLKKRETILDVFK